MLNGSQSPGWEPQGLQVSNPKSTPPQRLAPETAFNAVL